MSMSSVADIAKDYVHSLKSANDRKLKLGTVLFQLGAPVGLGLLAAAVRLGIPDPSDAVTGVSIVSALMCSVAVLLFQARVDLRHRFESLGDPAFVQGDLDLVDELFAQVLWSILSGFVLVLLLILESAFSSALAGFEPVMRLGCGVAWCLMANFALTVGIVLKRMRRVYRSIARGIRD